MKYKLLIVISALALLSMGCNTNSSIINDNASQKDVNTNSETTTTKTYVNSKYHFVVQYPEDNYSIACQGSQKNEAKEIPNNVAIGSIKIGAVFNCAAVEKDTFQGYIVYSANNIADIKSADAFVKKFGGADCMVEEWNNGNIVINSLISQADVGLCRFVASKYHIEYSAKYKTLVVWSLTQEQQFLNKSKIDTSDQFKLSFQ